jgi:protein TonB
MDKFYGYVGKIIVLRRRGLKGKVYDFCSWKDGSLTDIKVLRDIGYGTGKKLLEFTMSKMESGVQMVNR